MKFRTWLEAENNWQRFGHQRYFPFMSEKIPFSRRPAGEEFAELGEYSGYKAHAYYHGTPFLNRIKASGMLKSFAQLQQETDKRWRELEKEIKQSGEYQKLHGPVSQDNYLMKMKQAQGATSMGLGPYGGKPMTRHDISLTYNYGRAVEIYEGFQFVSMIIHNQVSAAQIWQHVAPDTYDDQLGPVDFVLRDYGVPKKVLRAGDEAKITDILNKKITNPEEKYEFFQKLEAAVTGEENSQDHEYINTFSQIGFAAPYQQMKQIDPKQIAIIQCVVRKDADLEHLPEEAEVRTDVSKVAVIRYIQP